MLLFLDDFMLFSDMDTHFPKLRKCFEKSMEFGIILNLDKCLLLVIFDIILGFIVSKEDKLPIQRTLRPNVIKMPLIINS